MKKLGKVVLVLLILVLLGVVGYGGYYLYSQNEEANKKIGELENKIVIVSENKNEVNIDTTENTSNNQSDKYEKIVPKYYSDYDPEIFKHFKSEYVSFSYNSEYIGLGIDEIIKNSDETYTVRGTAVSMYKLNDDEIGELEKTGYVNIEGKKCKKVDEDNEYIRIEECEADEYGFKWEFSYNKVTKDVTRNAAQYQEMYRRTDKKMEITLDKDVFVPSSGEVDIEEGEGESLQEFYNKMKGYTFADNYYNFGFKDGKCIEMLPIRFTT